MEIVHADRHTTVIVRLEFKDAPILTLLDGSRVQPQNITIRYFFSEHATSYWQMFVFKVRKDGSVGLAPKDVSDWSFNGASPGGASTPQWIKDLVEEHSPRVDLSEV